MTKSKKTKRTQVKGRSVKEQVLTSAELSKVKGGLRSSIEKKDSDTKAAVISKIG